jgi:DNA-directed RNA polymerase subunit RPC12/RpoP
MVPDKSRHTQSYVCPRCGHANTYDPWKGSAHCPHCGYEPSPPSPPALHVPKEHADTHQAFLDELLEYWAGRRAPDEGVVPLTPDLAKTLFWNYQRAMGEDPLLRAGAHMRYVRNYQPQPGEIASFVRAYLLLKRGERAEAAQALRRLTKRSPLFVDPWIWLTATSDEPTEREGWLERAVALDPAHPLAQDALAMLRGRVTRDGRRLLGLEHRTMVTACPQCGAAMHHEAGAAEVVCAYCGHKLHLLKVNLLEERAHLVSDLRLRRRYEGHTWQEIERVVCCKSCGAQLTMTQHLARSCLYCGSTNVIVEDSQRTFEKPDGLLPFEIDEVRAANGISRTERSCFRRLTHWLTRKEWRAESLFDIYLPFWVFDGYVEVRTWTEGVSSGPPSEQSLLRAETMLFENLLFPASQVPSRYLAEQLLPFDLQSLVPYDPCALADRQVALYSLDVEVVAEQAHDAMITLARQQVERRRDTDLLLTDRVGAESAAPRHLRRSYQVSGVSYQLVLLPVWLARVRSGDRVKLMVVNGQSGRVARGRATRFHSDGMSSGAPRADVADVPPRPRSSRLMTYDPMGEGKETWDG